MINKPFIIVSASLFLFFLLSVVQATAQVRYKPGYFITNGDERVDCLIKDIDWENAPESFNYKIDSLSSEKENSLKEVKEFGISDGYKYVRAQVQMDRSSRNLDKLTFDKVPEFKDETIFLKVLIEGQASLYVYQQLNLTTYFFSVDSDSIQQLVFKYYKKSANIRGEYRLYRNQLWTALKCDAISFNELSKLDYTKRDLTGFFKKYYTCKGDSFVNYDQKSKKKGSYLNISIRPAVGISSLSVDNSVTDVRDVDFGASISYRIGFELEFILPFNNNKWGVLLEPNFTMYQTEEEIATGVVKADYNSIELPFGLRYYSFISDRSKIFYDAMVVSGIPLSSQIDYPGTEDLELSSSVTVALGVGYNWKNKYSVQIRNEFGRDLLSRPLKSA
ncbi:MAG: hypothetical protein AAGF85_17260 [Bacteroidota bacterium]